MTYRFAAAALLACGMIVLPAWAPVAADEQNNLRAGDNLVNLPDEPADDEELEEQAGSPPGSAVAGVNVPLGQNSEPAASTVPPVDSGSLSTYSGNNTGIAISTVNAAITNNDFHN